MKTVIMIREAIETTKCRSAWDRGVKEYALDLLDTLDPNAEFCASPADRKDLFNGADSWEQYSWGGCALIYNADIAERLCTPSELKRCKGGDRRPNNNEEWLDTQVRALHQAARMICRIAKEG